MQVLKKFGVAGGALAVAAVSIALAAAPANADTGAQPGDAVGVGSDTVQNAADFVLDGSPGVAGGYNSNGNVNRVDNVFSTGDANGRTLYDGTCGAVTSNGLGNLCSTSNSGAPDQLASSVTLRAGTAPVVRPNGSGGGIKALVADSAGSTSTNYDGLPNGSFSYARASRLPALTTQEATGCLDNASGCGGLHVYEFATDDLGVARVSTGFNGPNALSANQLFHIFIACDYTTWGQVGVTGSAASQTIYPIVPPSTSGTGSLFLADLQTAGSSTQGFGGCTHTAQEHDPTGIYSAPNPANAIEPFSKGKLSLINKGYYTNGVSYSSASQANGAFTPGYLKLELGTPSAGGANYANSDELYFVVRQADVLSSKAFQPGSTENFVSALFTDSNSAIRSATGKSQITAAGFTPAYADCGVNPASASACSD